MRPDAAGKLVVMKPPIKTTVNQPVTPYFTASVYLVSIIPPSISAATENALRTSELIYGCAKIDEKQKEQE